MSFKDKLHKGALGGLTLVTALLTQHVAKPQELSDLLKPENVYAQDESLRVSIIDYEDLAKRAGEILTEKTYQQTLSMLKPYENDPNNKSALFYAHLGLAYRYDGDFAKAERYYKKALELNHNDESTRVNLGILYLRFINTLESRKLAEEQFNYVLTKINPNNSFAINYLKGMKSGRF